MFTTQGVDLNPAITKLHAHAVYMQGELTAQVAGITMLGTWPVIKNQAYCKATCPTKAQYPPFDLSK
jgi:hypothetical protein